MDNEQLHEMRQKVYAKERIAVLHERKRYADQLDAYAFDATATVHNLAGAVANHNLIMRKLTADTHSKIAFINKSGTQAAAQAAPKKQTAAKFFAAKAPKKPVKKAKPVKKSAPKKKAAKKKR